MSGLRSNSLMKGMIFYVAIGIIFVFRLQVLLHNNEANHKSQSSPEK